MKLSTKPISSPARTDKFPPPLMRFLRSNAGNRSRGRSRTSPIFLKKKNAAIETQEPSSPKVTCMGQVRVTRSAAGAPTKCHHLSRRWWVPKPGSSCYHCECQPVWRFFRRRKASKVTETPTKTEEESEYKERVINTNAFVSNSSSSSTPPRNAFSLTRCRSAPYRSSSLASMFWGSPLKNEETELENERPSSQTEQEEIKDPNLELKLRFFKELEDSLRENIMEPEKVHELKRREEDPALPLGLTRCKSEPARTGQKLRPEVNGFWKKTRLGFANTCFPQGL